MGVFSWILRAFVFLAFCTPALQAASEPALAAKSSILIDATTGTVLHEKNADLVIPPASLSKLMTIHVTLNAVARGSVRLDDQVELTPATWASNQPWGSSLMFLAPGQKVNLRELLLGLAVASGNDAAVAVALHVAGSIPAFAALMNREAAMMGLLKTQFVEPSGISEHNLTTARDFVLFCAQYLSLHPETLKEFHSVREFSYPKQENLPEQYWDKPGTINQYNRNMLLGSMEGVDGLKTGYIIESGYNLAITAERNGTRLIAVILGGPGMSSARGGRIRSDDGEALLKWGFDNFRTIRPVIGHLEPARVWKGKTYSINLIPEGPLAFSAATDRAMQVDYSVERKSVIEAPLKAGAVLGMLRFFDARGELKSVPLLAATDVPAGNILKRAMDSIALFFLRIFRRV